MRKINTKLDLDTNKKLALELNAQKTGIEDLERKLLIISFSIIILMK